MSKKSKLVSKTEALELLSTQLRRTDLEGGATVKLMTMYSKLQGWDTEQEAANEPDMDQLVTALEKKRKLENKIQTAGE